MTPHFHPVHLMNAVWVPDGHQTPTKQTDIGCKFTDNWQLLSPSAIITYYYYSTLKLILILLVHGGWCCSTAANAQDCVSQWLF